MERSRKIDGTLEERHGILHLLERMKKENISFAEMEEIGKRLQKSGKRALPPIVRKLWREKSGDLISKYTYLLDFFDDEVWIDQLIQITIKRKDLEQEGKEALLDTLEEYGVDVREPPFSLVADRDGSSLRQVLPKMLDKGEDGLVCFIEDILFYPQEERLELVRELPRVTDPRIVGILEILLGIDDRALRLETVTALGKVREPGAVDLLRRLCDDPDETVRASADRNLRRLSFAGVDAVTTAVPPLLPVHGAQASPLDGNGCRTLWLSRHAGEGRLAALYLQVHETEGIRAAWGSSGLTFEEFDRYLAETESEEAMMPVAPVYALALVRDALFRNGQNGTLLPAEFYVWRRWLAPEEVAPEPYIPEFGGHDLDALAVSARLIAGSVTLLDDDFFAGWGLTKGRVCDYAEEWTELEKNASGSSLARGMESLLDRFCRELLLPETERYARRLLLTADLMQTTGQPRELVERTLAAAVSLDAPQFRKHRHPFYKRLALESMELAREALAEGFDLRQLSEDENDEWE